jgi:hypothetical protein
MTARGVRGETLMKLRLHQRCNGLFALRSNAPDGATIQAKAPAAASAPASSAPTNGATSAGRMPEKLPVRAQARATAGLAKQVDAVNQYPAVTNSATG